MSFWGHFLCVVLVGWFLGSVLWKASAEYRSQHPEIGAVVSEALVSFVSRINRRLKW
jgi:hypothetical protein